jgi:TIR domain
MIEAKCRALESERNKEKRTVTSASGRQPYDIFISYRTTHADWVETLAHSLKAQGCAIFLDRCELIPGQLFPVQIHQAL